MTPKEQALRAAGLWEVVQPFERMDKEICDRVAREERIADLEKQCNEISAAIPGMTDVTCAPCGDGLNYCVAAGTETGVWEIMHKGPDKEVLWRMMRESIRDYAQKSVHAILTALANTARPAPPEPTT